MDIKLIFNYIEMVIAFNKIPKMEFYAAIGYTQPGYEKMKTNKSLKVETLFKIAEVLNVNPHHLLQGGATTTEHIQLIEKYHALLEKYNECLENTNVLGKKSELISEKNSAQRYPMQKQQSESTDEKN